MKVVINACFGGFGLSRAAFHRLRELGHPCARSEPDIGESWPNSEKTRDSSLTSFCDGIERNDPLLLQVIEELGESACSDKYASLRVVEIPDDTEWTIEEYDGFEHVAEKHRTWQ